MKVRTKITFHTAEGMVPPNSIIEMDDAEAKVNIARNFAEQCDEAEVVDTSKPPKDEDETDEATRTAGQVRPLSEVKDMIGDEIEIPGVQGTRTLVDVKDDGTLVVDPPLTKEELENVDGSEDPFEDEEEEEEEEEEKEELKVPAPAPAPVPAPAPAPSKPNGKKR